MLTLTLVGRSLGSYEAWALITAMVVGHQIGALVAAVIGFGARALARHGSSADDTAELGAIAANMRSALPSPAVPPAASTVQPLKKTPWIAAERCGWWEAPDER